MIKIILNGACGAMGKVIGAMAAEDPACQIVAGVDRVSDSSFAYPVYASFAGLPELHADVIIDFSTAAAVDGVLSYAAEKKIPAVVCTTGLSEEQKGHLQRTAEQTAVLRSANMSLGINLLEKLAAEAAKTLAQAGFDMEIVEKHHRRKLDAPSGTALELADSVNRACDGSYSYIYDRTTRHAPRDPQEIGISSVRGGSIVGDHDVIFAGEDEVITLSHTAYSRKIFAKGALSAAAFLAGKPAGFYTMADVISG